MNVATCRVLITMLLLSLCAFPVHAVLLKDYIKVKEDPDFKFYLEGVGVGYLLANGTLQVNKQDLLFCAPKSLALRRDNYLQILESYALKVDPKSKMGEEASVEYMLLLTLREMFPCQ